MVDTDSDHYQCWYVDSNGNRCMTTGEWVTLRADQFMVLCRFHLSACGACASCLHGPLHLDEDGLCVYCRALKGA